MQTLLAGPRIRDWKWPLACEGELSRAGCGLTPRTVLTTEAELFPGLRSAWVEVTTAVLVIEPAAVGWTEKLRSRPAPLARVPRLQVMMLPATVQPGGRFDTITLDGAMSVTNTPFATAGP